MTETMEITEFQLFFTVEQSIPAVNAVGSLWIGDAALAMPAGVYRVIDGTLYRVVGIEQRPSWSQIQPIADHQS